MLFPSLMLTTEQRWGYTGTILCTTNGGVNWNLQSSGTTVILFCVSFTDANNGTVVGDGGTILRTGIPPLPAPTLVSPTNGAINLSPTIKFDWNSVPTATSYRIRVANDSLFTSIVKDSTVSIDSLVLSGFLANQLYYWKVAAINTAGTGLYSTVWNFRINPVGINNYSSIIPKEF